MMKRCLTVVIFVLINILFSCDWRGIEEVSPKRYVVYVPWNEKGTEMAIDKGVMDKATHINLHFVNPIEESGDFNFTDNDKTRLKNFTKVAHENEVKVLISIGGGIGVEDKNNNPVYVTYKKWLQKENRPHLIQNFVNIVEELNLDGIDNDLEDACIDRNTYNPFVQELKIALDKLTEGTEEDKKLLTAAVAPYTSIKITNKTFDCYDFINLMSYDHTGLGSDRPGELASATRLDQELFYYCSTRGIHPHKVVIGVPFYAIWWKKAPLPEDTKLKGAISYERLVDLVGDKIFVSDQLLWGEGDDVATYSYSTPNTIKEKSLLARKYGGIMCWHFNNDKIDEKYSLSKIITDTFKKL